ncbi:hypothetical protein ACLKA7_004949 [Drosophila subpalustris]
MKLPQDLPAESVARHFEDRHLDRVRPSNVVDHPPRSQAPAPNRRVPPAQHRPSLQASRQHAQRNTVGPSRPLRPALAADSRQGQQRPPPKKAPLPGRGEPGGVDDPHRRTLCGSRTKWYIRYLQQGMSQEDALAKAKEPRPTTSGDRTPAKRSSSALTPPTDTPKRVRAAEPTAQRPGAANPVRAEHRAPKEGRQEARDERPCTSKAAAAAAAEPTARESTSSAPTEPRTSYAAVASKVKVAVLPVDYPQVILSHGELSALEEAILDQVILTGWDTAVSFVGIHFRVGHLVIDCTDQNSADWLLTVAPKLHSWKGVPLDCRMGDDIPSPHTITLYLPRSADRESGDLLVMLSNQNKMETDAWRVISRKEEGGGALLVLGIDEMAKNNIVARGHQLFFRFGKIPVSGLKRVAERDGMRAAPAPPEATALASEDPPPTGTNMETSPAASGSSVCPAGPSDPLEDLAEDEDLADLTLDPAAVEEIDEQMAMSSQELSEELEGADVTLTPCDDEGNSRPPSSCDMEPLL